MISKKQRVDAPNWPTVFRPDKSWLKPSGEISPVAHSSAQPLRYPLFEICQAFALDADDSVEHSADENADDTHQPASGSIPCEVVPPCQPIILRDEGSYLMTPTSAGSDAVRAAPVTDPQCTTANSAPTFAEDEPSGNSDVNSGFSNQSASLEVPALPQ